MKSIWLGNYEYRLEGNVIQAYRSLQWDKLRAGQDIGEIAVDHERLEFAADDHASKCFRLFYKFRNEGARKQAGMIRSLLDGDIKEFTR